MLRDKYTKNGIYCYSAVKHWKWIRDYNLSIHICFQIRRKYDFRAASLSTPITVTYKQRMRTNNVSDVTFSVPETSPRRRTPLTLPARPVCAIGTYFLDMPRMISGR
jgi:hypothetical protein